MPPYTEDSDEKQVAPVFIENIFKKAFEQRASDIHFEPQEKELIIRFRIDGILKENSRMPIEQYDRVLNRIKVLSRLRFDEHFTPQDGSIHYTDEKGNTDLRVSIIPTLDGEKVVIRILSRYVEVLNLQHLGMSPADQKIVLDSASKPYGMILNTGPTGSGKTTMLYAILKLLNRPEINITTIEDPVEYKMPGISQIQIHPEAKLTFANGLRTIVRQDPNIILVGEIRDMETAEVAVNAALTGHLLLSTFHANDAATVIPRFLDMGIEPFVLASALDLLIAQRLVRRICSSCKFSRKMSLSEVETIWPRARIFFQEDPVELFAGKGCAECGNLGYKGRIALFELIKINPEIRELIFKKPSAAQISEIAKAYGFHTLLEDGIGKVKSGLITLEELLKVDKPI